jgi:hypothetical protein
MVNDRVLTDKQIHALKKIGGVEDSYNEYAEDWFFGKEGQWEVRFHVKGTIAFADDTVMPTYVLCAIADAIRV